MIISFSREYDSSLPTRLDEKHPLLVHYCIEIALRC